jgi:hypothetical protein
VAPARNHEDNIRRPPTAKRHTGATAAGLSAARLSSRRIPLTHGRCSRAIPVEVWSDIAAPFTARRADEAGPDVRQPQLIRPAVGAQGHGMATTVVGGVDQDAARSFAAATIASCAARARFRGPCGNCTGRDIPGGGRLPRFSMCLPRRTCRSVRALSGGRPTSVACYPRPSVREGAVLWCPWHAASAAHGRSAARHFS